MREERPEINDQFDIQHVYKNINQNLLAASKKRSCHILQLWSKSIQNHFWWTCATYSEILLPEKQIKIIFHIQSFHVLHDHHMYTEYGHKILAKYRNKQWIDPTAQQTFVLMKTSSRRICSPQPYVFRRCLQDVFKTSWSRPIYLSWSYVFKTPSRRLQDVFKTSSRHLQDVLKTPCEGVFL